MGKGEIMKNKSFLEDIDIISFEESSELLFDLPSSFYVKEKRLI